MESISSNEIQLRSSNSIELRRNLEMNRKYFNSLSMPDKNILRAKMETKIDGIPEVSRKQMFAVLINSIAKDVGIKQIEQYDIAALYRFVVNYYATMALSEIKLAFELLLIGELDKFLPESADRKKSWSMPEGLSHRYLFFGYPASLTPPFRLPQGLYRPCASATWKA